MGQPVGQSTAGTSPRVPAGGRPLAIDIGDLVHYLAANPEAAGGEIRLITELSLALLDTGTTTFTGWSPHQDAFIGLPTGEVAAFLQGIGGPADATGERAAVLAHELSAGTRYRFDGGALLCPGHAWSVPTRGWQAARDAGVLLIGIVYDLIPITDAAGDPSVRRTFLDYLIRLLSASDHLLFISEATRRTVTAAASHWALALPPSTLLPLAGASLDERKQHRSSRSGEAGETSLPATPYLLMVGTVGRMKNQHRVVAAWPALQRTVPNPPALVIVGRLGADHDAFRTALVEAQAQGADIRHLGAIDDDTLSELYRGAMATIYAEEADDGWGLPVTESLDFGVPPFVLDRPARREAGASGARYFRFDEATGPDSATRLDGVRDRSPLLQDLLGAFLREPAVGAAWRAEIARTHQPRTWVDAAARVTAAVADTVPRAPMAPTLPSGLPSATVDLTADSVTPLGPESAEVAAAAAAAVAAEHLRQAICLPVAALPDGLAVAADGSCALRLRRPAGEVQVLTLDTAEADGLFDVSIHVMSKGDAAPVAPGVSGWPAGAVSPAAIGELRQGRPPARTLSLPGGCPIAVVLGDDQTVAAAAATPATMVTDLVVISVTGRTAFVDPQTDVPLLLTGLTLTRTPLDVATRMVADLTGLGARMAAATRTRRRLEGEAREHLHNAVTAQAAAGRSTTAPRPGLLGKVRRRLIGGSTPPPPRMTLRGASPADAPPADSPHAGTPTLVDGYPTWQAAVADSTGFDSPIILERVLAARRMVLDGEAAFEADGALFPEVTYSWPLLSGLLWSALREDGRLRVVDFGGSLGNHLQQNLGFLADCPNLRWGIVEQPSYVAAGRALDLDPRLTFHSSIAEAVEAVTPTVVLASGSIHLVEKPFDTLRALCVPSVRTLILDRTPMAPAEAHHRICVERVPDGGYPASFPSWLFARDAFYRSLPEGFTTVASFPALDGRWQTTGGVLVSHEGALLRR